MSAFAFKTPVQIERNGDTVSIVDAEAFILCNMEDADVNVNLRDAEAICSAINQHDQLLEALAYCLPRLHRHLADTSRVDKYFELLRATQHDKAS